MEKIEHFNVAVIGAGPAGSSAALSLCMHGAASVALVDKDRFPRDKICGDGVGPGAVHMMNELGLAERLVAHQKIDFISVSSPSGIRVKGSLPPVGGTKPIGYAIPRLIFDKYIFDGALAAGAFDLTGHSLVNAEFKDTKWLISIRNEATGMDYTISADCLVGADGARSKVRRILKQPFNSDRHTGTACRAYITGSRSSFDALQIDFTKKLLPAYGWIFPSDEHNANIGVGIDLDNYKRQGLHLEELFQSYLKFVGVEATNAEPTGYGAYILPYGSELPRLAFPEMRAALIGDAGSMVNPLTGEGIYYGMYAGELLGRLLGPATQGSPEKRMGAFFTYQDMFLRKFKSHFDINWAMKEKVENPRWCDMVINACKRDRTVLSQLIDIMMGDEKDINIGMILRIVMRNVLPF